MYSPVCQTTVFVFQKCMYIYIYIESDKKKQSILPGYSPTFHLIRQRHVVWPHVELPFTKSQDAAVDTTRMYSHPHVDVDVHHVPYQSKKDAISNFFQKIKYFIYKIQHRFSLLMHNARACTYVMASIMSKPIWTQQLAWSGLCSGRPLTQ